MEPFQEPLDWGTLIELINEDYEDLHHKPTLNPASAAAWLLDRLDAARVKVGAAPALGKLTPELRRRLEEVLDKRRKKRGQTTVS